MRALFLILGCLLLAACSVPERRRVVGDQCTRHSECDAPLVCRIGYCRTECRTSSDCIAPRACVLDANGIGACQLDEERDCTLATDCPAPLVCIERQCVNMCAEDRDCLPGARCISGGCIELSTTECSRHGDCARHESCIDARCRPQCVDDRDCENRYECIHPAALGVGAGVCVPIGGGFDAGVADGGGSFDGGGSLDGGGTDGGMSACATPSSPATSVAAGISFSCASLVDGRVACWGSNFFRTLGTTTGTVNSVPVFVDGIAMAVRVESSGETSCAVLADGTVRCWGVNGHGQVGDGTRTASSMAVEPTGLGSVRFIRPGVGHVCAADAMGDPFCWGQGDDGALGDNIVTTHDVTTPQAVMGLAGVDRIVAGPFNTCAIVGTQLYCWGNNAVGRAATGSMVREPVPALIMGLTATTVDIDYDNGCAVDTSQQLWCWGDDLQGALGNGTGESDSEIPQRVTAAMLARDVSVGSGYTCIITTTGAVQCWGVNNVSQLADDTTSRRELPGPTVAGLPGSVDQLAAGNDHVCARVGTAIYCWGGNSNGAIGQPFPAVTESAVPVQVCIP